MHSNMRFAWLRKQSGNNVPAKLKLSYPLNLVYLAYNFVYWIPIVLAFAGVITYYWGFTGFFIVILIRGTANLVRNNILKPQQAENFPLRS